MFIFKTYLYANCFSIYISKIVSEKMADDALPSPNFDKKPEGSLFREGGGGGKT